MLISRPHYNRVKVADKTQFVRNLSGKHLTQPQLSILSKGLSFNATRRSEPELDTGVRKLGRTLRLDHFFGNEEDTPLPPPDPFRIPSLWQPPPATASIESYLAAFPSKLEAMSRKDHRPNITRAEGQAIGQLFSDRSLVIKKADKGSCVVVEDRASYIADGLNHLSDPSIYAQVPTDTTIPLAKAINAYIDSLLKKGHINKAMHSFLTHPKPSQWPGNSSG